MNKIQAKKLLRLADYLEKVVAKKARGKAGQAKFSMSDWFVRTEGCTATKPGLTEASCGTSGCAMGWATNVFPKDLCIEIEKGQSLGNIAFRSGRGVAAPTTWLSVPAMGVPMSFFGLVEQEAIHLFGGQHGRSAKKEASVIRTFVKKSGVLDARNRK